MDEAPSAKKPAAVMTGSSASAGPRPTAGRMRPVRKSCVRAVRTLTARSAFAKNAVREPASANERAHDARLREVEERRADRVEEEERGDPEEVARAQEEPEARERARAGRDSAGGDVVSRRAAAASSARGRFVDVVDARETAHAQDGDLEEAGGHEEERARARASSRGSP